MKKITLILLLVICLLALVACSDNPTTSSAPETSKTSAPEAPGAKNNPASGKYSNPQNAIGYFVKDYIEEKIRFGI